MIIIVIIIIIIIIIIIKITIIIMIICYKNKTTLHRSNNIYSELVSTQSSQK